MHLVAAVGDITTYSGYPVSTASYTFTKPPAPTFTTVPVETPALYPYASNTLINCTLYENAFNNNITNSEILNTCENWASSYNISVASLISWNPSLSANNCSLRAGYSYCLDSGVPSRELNVCRSSPNKSSLLTNHIHSCTCISLLRLV
jgi:hypothetical protein